MVISMIREYFTSDEDEEEASYKEEDEYTASQIDILSYALFGNFTEYIIDETTYQDYTIRLSKPSRYYISRIFSDTIIAFLISLGVILVMSALYVGGVTSTIIGLLALVLELFSIIPWIVSVSYNSIQAVIAPLFNLMFSIVGTFNLQQIAQTLVGIPGLGIIFGLIFGVFAIIGRFVEILSVELSTSEGIESPSSDIDISSRLSENIISADIFGVILLLLMLLITFGVFIYRVYLPIYINNEIDRSVEKNRAEAYLFLYAMTKGGLGIGQAIEELGNAGKVYGKTSEAFRSIDRRAKFSSLNLRDSIIAEANYINNEELSEFLYGIVNNMDAGSDVSSYMEEKAKESLEIRRSEQESFFGILDMLSEAYVILIVVFPIFILVIQMVAGIIGSAFNEILVQLIPYMFIPAGGLIISVIIYILGDSGSTFTEISKPSTTYEMRNPQILEEDESSFSILENILYNPKYAVLFTLPITLIYVAIVIDGNIIPFTLEGWNEDPIIPTFYGIFIPILILTLPWSIIYEWEKRRRRELERQLNNLLDVIRSSNERGLTLQEALESSVDVEEGELYTELENALNKSRVTNQLNRSLIELSNRIKVPRISEAMYLITRSNQVSGNISNVLDIISTDFGELYKIKVQRKQNAREYAAIILMSLLVGTLLVLAIDVLFFEFILGQTPTGDEASEAGGPSLFGDIPQGLFRRIFLHTVLSIGIVSGLVIGIMENGNPENGLKYMIAFATLGIVAFVIRLGVF